MSGTPTINTTIVADTIKDHLDDLMQQEAVSPSLYNKIVSYRRILNAINIADIDACRIIKQEMQMIIHVPKGTDEVYLDRAPSFINPTDTVNFQNDVFNETNDALMDANVVFLNRELYIDASNIRGEFLQAYNKFPKGNATPIYKIKIMAQDAFDNAQRNGYSSPSDGSLSVAYYEAANKRLRFGAKFSQDTFISFSAYMIPSKINPAEFGGNDFCDYKVRTPTYAEQYLVYRALEKALPLGSAGHKIMRGLVVQEQANIYELIPQNTSTIEITDGYIG